MLNHLPPWILQAVASLPLTVLVLKALVNFIFAAAVAKNAGQLTKIGRETYLVSGITWSFAVLLGGVLVVGLYWLMHYSSLARTNISTATKTS